MILKSSFQNKIFITLFTVFIFFLLYLPITVSTVEIPLEYTVKSDVEVEIVEYKSANQNEVITLSSRIKNVWNKNITKVWLAWELPAGWSILSGNKNVSFELIQPNQTTWNNITVNVGESTGSKVIRVIANSLEKKSGADSKTVNVYSVGGVEGVGRPNGGGVGGGGGGTGGEGGIPSGEVPVGLPAQPVMTYIADSKIETYQNQSVLSLIRITNSGGTNLTDVKISILGFPEEWYSYTPSNIDLIPPGQTASFIINFTPNETGSHSFIVNITSKETSHAISYSLLIKGPEEAEVAKKVEEVKEKVSVIKPLLVISGIIGPAVIATYMILFILVKRCPMCGSKMNIEYKYDQVIGYRCSKCKYFKIEERKINLVEEFLKRMEFLKRTKAK